MQRTQRHFALSLLILFLTAVLTGCGEIRRPAAPILPVNELVLKTEANMNNINRFKSTDGRLSAKLYDEKGIPRTYDLDGVSLLYETPRNVYMSGKYFGQPAILLGSNKEKYWIELQTDPCRLYWGRWQFAGDENNEWFEAGPNQLFEAIGRIRLKNEADDEAETLLIGPALQRRDNQNVLIYMDSDPIGNWYVAKEILLSPDEPMRVLKISHFNPNGEIKLSISFSDYTFIAPNALLAKKIFLDWPKEKGYLHLTLGKISMPEKFHPAAFIIPDFSKYNPDEIHQVDKNCKPNDDKEN